MCRLLRFQQCSNDLLPCGLLHHQEEDSARSQDAKQCSLVNSVVNTNQNIFYDFGSSTRSQETQWDLLIQHGIRREQPFTGKFRIPEYPLGECRNSSGSSDPIRLFWA